MRHDAPAAFDVEALIARIDAAFVAGTWPPAMSLRAGNAIDSGLPPPAWDASLARANYRLLERRS